MKTNEIQNVIEGLPLKSLSSSFVVVDAIIYTLWRTCFALNNVTVMKMNDEFTLTQTQPPPKSAAVAHAQPAVRGTEV